VPEATTSPPSPLPSPLPGPLPDGLPPGRTRVSLRARLRNYFLTGVIVAGPLAITIYITWWCVALVDGWFRPLIPAAYLPDTHLPFTIPGLGLLIALVGLTLLGALTANLVGRSVIEFGEVLLARTPVVRGLYKGLRQIFETLFSSEGTSFRTVGLVEFPVKGTWSVVFLSAPAPGEVEERLPAPGDYVGVFMPCAPNPTTGFFFYLPRREVIEIGMSVDDAAKLVMSAGVIQPEDPQGGLHAMAANLRAAQGAAAPAGAPIRETA
jgi:uncharacterized membrane protein